MKPHSYLRLARSHKTLPWLARLFIAPVFLWNVQCAIAFLAWPGRFAAGFELSGTPGEAAIRALGVLFLMWNIPYAVALWQPVRYHFSVYESTAMQALGLFGEAIIWLNLPPDYTILHASIWRFILFDAGGFVLLLIAIWITHRSPLMKPVTRTM